MNGEKMVNFIAHRAPKTINRVKWKMRNGSSDKSKLLIKKNIQCEYIAPNTE